MRSDNQWILDAEQDWLGSDDAEWAHASAEGGLDDFDDLDVDDLDLDELDLDQLDLDGFGDFDAEDDEFFDPNERGLASALRSALNPMLARSSPEVLVSALHDAMDSMSHAESFNFTKALHQIGRGAQQAASNPLVGQIARTALPVAAGATGTLLGGPAGMALGTSLGAAVAKSLPVAGPATRPGAASQSPIVAATAGGSLAARQGLVLSQQPDVLKALLALALGERGAASINGVPVGSVMSMLSTVFNKAAEDADELFYSTAGADGEVLDYGDETDVDGEDHRALMLYSTMLASEEMDLQEAMVQ